MTEIDVLLSRLLGCFAHYAPTQATHAAHPAILRDIDELLETIPFESLSPVQRRKLTIARQWIHTAPEAAETLQVLIKAWLLATSSTDDIRKALIAFNDLRAGGDGAFPWGELLDRLAQRL